MRQSGLKHEDDTHLLAVNLQIERRYQLRRNILAHLLQSIRLSRGNIRIGNQLEEDVPYKAAALHLDRRRARAAVASELRL